MHPDATQRDLAKALGISLGSTNFCVRALIDQGWVKVRNFRRSDNKRAYAYLLTPQGIEAKARITARFLQRKRTEYLGEVINIGSSFEISIGDTAATIAEVMGAEIEILTDEQRLRPEKSEVERLFADNRKAADLLGWRPAYGGLDGFRRGLEHTAAWFADPRHLALYKSDRYNL
ncbi:MarR family EPS-associated transcriptional regulator [Thiocapsa sp.]|uniref:MarR family EPS-associated transcriptional regulator n=1 Tax=Thiocapsa sp. TaxID=2024551 RepID=UPI0026158F06|nr:MarR family EPS-associated transcriptional regulator [Thiocapsa sp.]